MARIIPRPTNSGGGGGTSCTEQDDNGGNSSGSELPSQKQQQHQHPLPSVADPDISYNLPQWLAPEKQTAMSFSIPLPDVPIKTNKAIRSFILKHKNYSQKIVGKDSARLLQNLKINRQEEKQATSKVKTAKDKLAQALLLKSEKLKEIRKAHELKNTNVIEELERTMREEQLKEFEKVEQQIKEDFKLEYGTKFDEEICNKRKREQEEDEKEGGEAEEGAIVAAEAPAPTNKEDHIETSGDSGIDGGEANSKIEVLKQKQEELQGKMEKLSEKKREMFWLLKQVIRQEAMRKMKKKKLVGATAR
ncbi:hypothetical protein FRACYDRAFT_238895 [Fragilariopsis cylindrus CCMP1102]|uniref:Uncharacterized protein n=1 Tax=Fragilariopsis cylindrus CCMP1102 TaxID=635003 RepID=A0A1E7FET5_9STRA|nr:hypothetical protein FRACYDRAFT_238895 [Fragilariopsis cylindrus CCMP1102]|eukprot:OEU16303.1 hypothetical protein FRACYDRAFT_238895 [Fragilariopsis cylindrus CCMP1102]